MLSNSSVNISWKPPLLSNGIILYYYISIRSLTENQSVIFNLEENACTISNLSWLHLQLYFFIIYILFIAPYTPYEVNISAVTIAGIGKPLHKVFFTKERGK